MNSTSNEQRMNEEGEGCIVALGNILLDLIVNVDEQFLAKYGLRPDITVLAEDRHEGIFDELVGMKTQLNVGGSAANTQRIAQWLLDCPGSTVFIGALGDDEASQKLLDLMNGEGIVMKCQKIQNMPSGRCAVLACGMSRTLVTKVGASVSFDYEKWMESWKDIVPRNCGMIYISGYFFRVSFQAIEAAIRQGYSRKIPIVLNINAEWVAEMFYKEIDNVMPYVDYLIGNEQEIKAYSRMVNSDALVSVVEIAQSMSSSQKLQEEVPRTVIVTRGKDALLVLQGGQVKHYYPIQVPESAILDTNGAGDAFAGGFLAGLAKKVCLSDCIAAGLWAASEVIQRVGCSFPKEKKYADWSRSVH